MEPGQVCHLRCTDHISPPINHSDNVEDERIVVTVVVVAARPHAEDRRRRLYYARCVHVGCGAALARQRKKAAAPSWQGVTLGGIGSGTIHGGNEFRITASGFVSSDGYHYRYDGWYEATALQCVEGPEKGEEEGVKEEKAGGEEGDATSASSPTVVSPSPPTQRRAVLEEWVSAMERDTAVCEVVYLCYAFQPWFAAPYTALQYLALPEEDVCHSVYVCHRCLSPFFTREQYFVHVEGQYCLLRRPPGYLLYHDEETGYKAFLVDGAKDLHYCRCLSLLGKHFIESKLLCNDVDLYEYVVVTAPRSALPYCSGTGMTAEDFHHAAAAFDSEDWDGEAVMGYFSRLKHHPDHTLSCIVTLPMFQRMRVATFLLDLAYWMTRQRQRLCGRDRCCGSAGGAISRPFSPHGQSLLLTYWRRALLRALDDVAPRRRASRVAEAEPSFTLSELQSLMDIPIHATDLEMLLLHSEFTFYAAVSSNERDGTDGANVNPHSSSSSGGGGGIGWLSSSKKSRREGQAGGRPASSPTLSTHHNNTTTTTTTAVFSPSSPSSAGQRYTVTMVLESTLLDAAQERPAKASSRRSHVVFQRRWLVKDAGGAHAYDFPQFHY